MNILLFFSQPWRVGGAETHVEALIKGLPQDRIFLIVNKGSDEQKLANLQQNYPELRIYRLQFRGLNAFSWISDFIKIISIIKEHQIDVISAQQRTAGIWSWLLHKFTAVPFTVTMHDAWHRALFCRLYSRLFPTMIVVSNNLQAILTTKFGFLKSQIHLINNGVDFSKFVSQNKEASRAALGLPKQQNLIVHASRLSSIKGAVALSLIDCMREVVRFIPDVRLVIIGEGPLRDAIEKKTAAFNAQYGDVIQLEKFTDTITGWYNSADVIVGEGRVAIEALACERPVVAIRNANTFLGAVTASNIGEAMEANFDKAVQTVTPKALAAEIRTAFSLDEEECAWIADEVRQKLGIDKMAAKYKMIFSSLIDKH
ncbi:glycosyltransferase [Sporomusa acidovorans]|uniref:D-inositol-3-phosphate glycosyltransferase n=1 Tax=Sporomusa acidovorans (strain ATCC 49682 / DSM 3132 / Mol) TaxID=1123286 RepID=A0ABZ3J809_SPOA4|nr:glycosyltransferase [Sporomusa acidovorans]OZC19321.1 GDP-mannose-dependent alpha-(1-6)-phosphatidylinositol dimannoside mannosyltransferase [Sporomusa acidovorans DSM 3132]SDD80902.1 Glycosyltransferase involved in cell wall bisynthesis [Sporomusa acidovorans]